MIILLLTIIQESKPARWLILDPHERIYSVQTGVVPRERKPEHQKFLKQLWQNRDKQTEYRPKMPSSNQFYHHRFSVYKS